MPAKVLRRLIIVSSSSEDSPSSLARASTDRGGDVAAPGPAAPAAAALGAAYDAAADIGALKRTRIKEAARIIRPLGTNSTGRAESW